MRTLLTFFACCLLLAGCGEVPSLTVTVTNPLPSARTGEMIELPLEDIARALGKEECLPVAVYSGDSARSVVPSQVTYDGKLIFPVSVPASGEATYRLLMQEPDSTPVRCTGRVYPQRLDDLAWENELVAFRTYGPALQATGERGFGYDLFAKHTNDRPVLETMYRQAIEEGLSYHEDHGLGMDCYAGGPTLGAGTAALVEGDTLIYPWCYESVGILDNGPLRFTASLLYKPFVAGTDSNVVEHRLITLDAGSRLNRTEVTYIGLFRPASLAVGIVLHEPDGEFSAEAAKGFISYNDPTTGPDNGRLFVGAAFPTAPSEAKAVLFPESEKKRRNNACGHVLALNRYEPRTTFRYYWGFAWSRTDIQSMEQWNRYLEEFVQRLHSPLQVRITKP